MAERQTLLVNKHVSKPDTNVYVTVLWCYINVSKHWVQVHKPDYNVPQLVNCVIR